MFLSVSSMISVRRESVWQRLAHADRLEAPVVPGVERGGVDQQDRCLGPSRGIGVCGIEAAVATRLDQQLAHLDLLLAIAGASFAWVLPGLLVEVAVVEIADPVAARVLPREEHLDVLQRVGQEASADVLTDGVAQQLVDLADEAHVIVADDLPVGFFVKQAAQAQVIDGADDRNRRRRWRSPRSWAAPRARRAWPARRRGRTRRESRRRRGQGQVARLGAGRLALLKRA